MVNVDVAPENGTPTTEGLRAMPTASSPVALQAKALTLTCPNKQGKIQEAILERKGNFISRDLLPSKWVLDGASACLIAEELKEGDDNAFLEDSKKFVLHRNTSPFQLRDGTDGLTEVYKPPNRQFHPEAETFGIICLLNSTYTQGPCDLAKRLCYELSSTASTT